MKPVDVRNSQLRSIALIALTAFAGLSAIRTDLIVVAVKRVRGVISVASLSDPPAVTPTTAPSAIQSGGAFSLGTPAFGGGSGFSSGGGFSVSGNFGQPVVGSSSGSGFGSSGGSFTGQAPACPTLLIAQTTLQSGQTGQPYNQQLSAALSTGAITWSIASGVLPAGLTLDSATGLISGVPRAGGSFPIDVAITDSNTCTGQQTFSLVINSVTLGAGHSLSYDDGPLSGQLAGSVLIYNIFTSSSTINSQDTRFTLTNVNPQSSAFVHLFFVDGESCAVADSFVCLTPNQTTSFMAGDLDPETTGYLIAVATDANGCPARFNFLIGTALVKFQSGHSAALPAQAASALTGWSSSCNGNSSLATLDFNGRSYSPLPRALAVSSITSRADGNQTMLIVNQLGGDLTGSTMATREIYGLVFDDQEVGLSFTASSGGCQLRSIITGSFPRTTPRIDRHIPAGRSGWMKFWANEDQGIAGAVINRGSSEGGFNQGHNLHVLTTTDRVTYIIPILPHPC